MCSNRLARQSFGVLKFAKTVYFLSYACGRRKKEGEERRREKINKIEIFKFGFSNLLKVSGPFGVDIRLKY